jgi:DMSO reductase anchor subunit
MQNFYYTKLLIPAIVVIAGIYYMSIPEVDAETKTFWKYLTFFALVIGVVRAWMMFKKNEK